MTKQEIIKTLEEIGYVVDTTPRLILVSLRDGEITREEIAHLCPSEIVRKMGRVVMIVKDDDD